MNRDAEIYKAYLGAKNSKNMTVVSVARSFGITRNGIYEIIRRVEGGNIAKIKSCTERSRLDCLWEYKYKTRYMAIPKDRKEVTVDALIKIIKEMSADKFPIARISRHLRKDRSTILYHLEKNDPKYLKQK